MGGLGELAMAGAIEPDRGGVAPAMVVAAGWGGGGGEGRWRHERARISELYGHINV